MNELLNNFINEIEDVNKVNEMSVEQFIKLVKSNNLISAEEGDKLIESFKKISAKKESEDDSTDSDQRKKKYIVENKDINQKIEEKVLDEREDDSIER